jgi:endoglucanase
MNKQIKGILVVGLISFFSFSGFSQSSNYGVNLAGLDFGPNVIPGIAGSNFFVPNAAELDYYNSKGLSLIRLPFLWERAQPTLGGNLDETYMGYIDGIVAAATDKNMSIILDMHNYARYSHAGVVKVIGATGGPTLDNFKDVWSKIALRYKDKTAVWGFDLMNEPHDLGSSTVTWFTMAQAGINAIRMQDQTHVIFIEGDNWSKGNTWSSVNDNLKNLVDPNTNLIFQAHQYFDHDQSGQYLKNDATVAGAGANANKGVSYITPFVNWLNINNLKGIVGEYGVPNNSDLTNWNELLTNFMNYIQQNCVGGTYWAGGPAWGNYVTSIEPTKSGTNYIDAPQMAILSKYTSLPSSCALSSKNISIALTNPTGNNSIESGSTFTLSADATATVGNIVEVDFYANGILLGTSTASPYSFDWVNVPFGTYFIKAIAKTDVGQVASSLSKVIYVAAPVYAATQTPIIDGKPDPMWNNYSGSNLNKVITGSVPNAAFLSANWKATYDQTNLYVLVTVQDQTLVNTKGAAVYNDDGIEIYFDNGNTKTSTYSSNQFQYAFRWNDPIANEYIHKATTGVVFAQSNQGVAANCTSNCQAIGYTMEVKIPWSTLGVTNPSANLFEGFEVMVNDNNSGSRIAKIAWTATSDNAYQNPSLFGTVILKDAPCTSTGINTTSASSTTFCKGHAAKLMTDVVSSNYQWYRNASLIPGATYNSYSATMYGDYIVAILDANNCTSSSTVPIQILVDSSETHAGPDQFIATTNTNLAANAPFTINTGLWTVASGTGVFVDATLYNTSVTGLSKGDNTFTWTIKTDSCGTSQDNVTIEVGDKPTPSAISGSNIVQSGQTSVVYSFTPSNNSDVIQWTVPTGATITNHNADNTQITVDFGTATTGMVAVIETNKYASTTQQLPLSITTAILDSKSGASYSVKPNPFQTTSTIVVSSLDSEFISITIMDMNGHIVERMDNQIPNSEVSVGSGLAAGIYVVNIQQGTVFSMIKLIKL